VSRWFLALFGSLPLVALAALRLRPGSALVGALDAWFALHCHQDPSRTVTLGGQLLPVCARCTGLYLGLLAGAVLARSAGSPRVWLGVLAAGCLVLGLDVGTQALGLRVSSLGARVVTGLLVAYPAAQLAVGTLGSRPASSERVS